MSVASFNSTFASSPSPLLARLMHTGGPGDPGPAPPSPLSTFQCSFYYVQSGSQGVELYLPISQR